MTGVQTCALPIYNIKFNDPQLAITGTLSVSGNANVGNIGATNIVGTLTTAAQTNITSVGNLSGLRIDGATVANGTLNAGRTSVVAGTETSSANIPLQISQTWNNASATFTGILENITDTTSSASSLLMDLQVGGATKFNVNKSGNVSAAGNITGSYFLGNGSQLTGVAATSATTAVTVTANAQPNITSTGTLASLSVSGNANIGNIGTAGVIVSSIATGTAPFTVTSTTQVANLNVAQAGVAGTVTTAAQPNITSVGTLTGLGVNGTVTAVNITANTGVITGNANGKIGRAHV